MTNLTPVIHTGAKPHTKYEYWYQSSYQLTGHMDSGCASVCAYVRPFIKNCACEGFEILCKDSSWKNSWHIFFSCLSYLPFWSYAPLKKSKWKSDACHILWTVHARVLKFHIWIPHGKIADRIFILVWVLKLCPFEKIGMKSCQQDISKTIWARGLHLVSR